jgi:hypothetical protein
LIGDVVDDDDPIGTAVVTAGNGSEAFLASCIPDLELNVLAINLDSLKAAASSHEYRKSTPIVVR